MAAVRVKIKQVKLDVRSLNASRYWHEEQIVMVLGHKEARQLLKRLEAFRGIRHAPR